MGIVGLWLIRRAAGNHQVVVYAYMAVTAVGPHRAALACRVMQKSDGFLTLGGKKLSVFQPGGATYGMVYLTCAVVAVAVAAGLGAGRQRGLLPHDCPGGLALCDGRVLHCEAHVSPFIGCKKDACGRPFLSPCPASYGNFRRVMVSCKKELCEDTGMTEVQQRGAAKAFAAYWRSAAMRSRDGPFLDRPVTKCVRRGGPQQVYPIRGPGQIGSCKLHRRVHSHHPRAD